MSYSKSVSACIYGLLILFSMNTYASQPNPGFESSEHISAAENIQLFFSTDQTPIKNFAFTLDNGATIPYSEIMTLGDFYEIVGKPLGDPTISDAERKQRFIDAFDSFAKNKDVVTELTQILAVIKNEKQAVEDGVKDGEKPEDVYKRIGKDNNRQWNCITGGDCSKNYWIKPGRYVKLAAQDFSHFSDAAWRVYLTGHNLAVNEAIQAHKTGDIKKLEHAYALNAFACHYLSDEFAAGHIRTTRYELFKYVTPAVVGSILSAYMHTEENENSLHVHNARGDHWIAWGDKYYFVESNSENRKLLNEALQKSADHIFTAYQTGTASDENDIAEIIPHADEMGSKTNQDIAALFYWDENTKKLMRRSDVSKLHDYHWTSDWWGWSTLVLLSQLNGLPTEAQGLLAKSEMREQALKDGLITDKEVYKSLSS